MTRKNNYNYQYPVGDQKIIKKLSDLKYDKGNIALSEDADTAEKMKYSVCQSILTYHQESKKSLAIMAKEIGIKGITEKTLYDICRGKISDFCLGELVIYATNLRISSIPCYHCGVNLFPSLLEAVILSLKEQESLSMKSLDIYKKLENHQDLIRSHL